MSGTTVSERVRHVPRHGQEQPDDDAAKSPVVLILDRKVNRISRPSTASACLNTPFLAGRTIFSFSSS